MTRFFLWPIAALALLGTVPAHADTAKADRCAALAASPDDPQTPADTGLNYSDISTGTAMLACKSAVKEPDSSPRTLFHLGRVLDSMADYERAEDRYQAAAEAGFPLAYVPIGNFHQYGYGYDIDLSRAKEYYTRAFDEGDLPIAAANLGDFSYYGWAGPTDTTAAAEFYQIAADGGIAWAMINLGVLHETGDGVGLDYAKAAELYRLGAEAGDLVGWANLGWLTENGNGVPASDTEAVRLYQLAADGDISNGLNNLGVMYLDGRGGLEESPEEAMALYKRAADLGYGLSMTNLAELYYDGQVVPQDIDEAIRYYEMAIAQDDDESLGIAQNGLAWLYAIEKTNLEEAEDLARAAVAEEPTSAYRQDTLAWVLYGLGDYEGALPAAQTAFDLESADPTIAAHLGDIHRALGNTTEARTAYETAIATAPAPADYSEPTVDLAAIRNYLEPKTK